MRAPANGFLPVRHPYSAQPNDHRSMRASSGARRDPGVRIEDTTLQHAGDGMTSERLVTLLAYPLERLEEGQRGDDELLGVFNGFREKRGVRTVGEVLDPRPGIREEW